MRRYRYLTTCPAGLEALLRRDLAALDPDALVDTKLSGLLAFQSATRAQEVLALRGASNAFSILCESGFASAAKAQGRLPDPAKLLLKALDSEKTLRDFPLDSPARSFRIMVSCENALVPIDRAALSLAERAISEATGLTPARAGADTEFWLLIRNEGRSYFCQRLSRRRATERELEKGELKPELAYAICAIASPRPGDKLLDPFCGSGAIALECAAAFPGVSVLSADLDAEKAARAGQRFAGIPLLSAKQADFFDPDAYAPGSFSAIVTDPPWGAFRELDDPAAFYGAFAKRCAELIAGGGKLALLSGAKETCLAAMASEPAFELAEKHDLLVSGRKACLCLYRRRNGDEAPTSPLA